MRRDLWCARTLCLLLSLAAASAASAQTPARKAPAAKAVVPTGPATAALLLFVKPESEQAFLKAGLVGAEGWQAYREVGPQAGKNGGKIYLLLSNGPVPAASSEALVQTAIPFLTPRGGNTIEMDPIFQMGEPGAPGAAPAPARLVEAAATPAAAPTVAPSAGDTSAGDKAPVADKPAAPDKAATGRWQFTGTAGVLFFFVRPTRDATFRTVLEQARTALRASTDGTRQRQAAGWRVFKARGAGPAGAVMYVSILDPTVPGADYAVSPILADALDGDDLNMAFTHYADGLASGNLLDLERVPPR